METALRQLTQQEQLNFLLTNRIPRHALTRLMGWYSKIESPALTRASMALWQLFADDLRLDEAEQQSFNSLHECFTRQLKPGMRPIDPRVDVLSSPCDAVVGECGPVAGTTVFQAKGFPYEIGDLIPDPVMQETYRDGCYATLRLKSSMYHRFHAPLDCAMEEVRYISGDTWNVNPVALKRVEKLYCRNERAVVPLITPGAGSVCLVPVAAVLVASMRFHALPEVLDLQYRGPNRIPCSARYAKGEEMGYFQHGSTIIVFATSNYTLAEGIAPGQGIRMGQALMRDSNLPVPTTAAPVPQESMS
jgi:phosphatidylserine decarboxylase